MSIPQNIQKQLYKRLAAEVGFGEEEATLAFLGHIVNDEGIDRTAYGYDKLYGFACDLDIVEVVDHFNESGLNLARFTLLAQPQWDGDENDAPAEPVNETEPAPAPAAAPAPAPAVTVSGDEVAVDFGIYHLAAKPERRDGAFALELAKGQRPVPGREIIEFGYLGPWEEFLSTLSDEVLPENWDFDGEEGQRSILHSYITYTFYRLRTEGKVLVNADRTIAAFNTGLVNDRYDEIFAMFEPNRYRDNWYFSGFCTKHDRGLGKKLVGNFNPLPETATYFERKEDLLFDTDRELIINYDHMIVDNMSRLPVAYLREELHDCPEALELLDQAEDTHDNYAKKAILNQVGEILEDDARLFRRLRNRFDDAVDLACRRVSWNFKTAIPVFYPSRDAMSLLLPLDLDDDGTPDIALAVELMPSGNYQGQTILTLRMAYNNARLVCRPDSDWLTTHAGLTDEDNEEE